MKAFSKSIILTVVGAVGAFGLLQTAIGAEGEKDSATKAFMKKYHKAPQGTDTVAKKAQNGKATPEELKELVAGYKAMAKSKPPRGDEASWKEKTAKLASAAEELQAGKPDGAAHYKEAVNCKACHSVHKPE